VSLDLEVLANSLERLNPAQQDRIHRFMAGRKSDEAAPDPPAISGSSNTAGRLTMEEAMGLAPAQPDALPGRAGLIAGANTLIPGTNMHRYKAASGPGWGDTMAAAVFGGHGGIGAKQLIGANGVLPVYMPAEEPVEMGRPLVTFRQLLPVGAAPGGQYRYLEQTLRDNQAAIVAPGATKPTSTWRLEWRDGRTSVVAHVSEPMDRFMFSDAPQLASFVDSEMRYGVEDALERALLFSGPDVPNGKNWVGFLHANSGIAIQGFDTDVLTTLRRAKERIDSVGRPVQADAIVLHPSTWADLELLRDGQDRFLLTAGPGSTSSRVLWDLPVALCAYMTRDQALVGHFGGSCALAAPDNGEISIQWSDVAMDVWVKNQTIWRGEGRWALAIMRKPAFCQVLLTPTTPLAADPDPAPAKRTR
jgi:Phage capsid family